MEILRRVYDDLCSFNDYIRAECPQETFLGHASSDLESTLNSKLRQIQLSLEDVKILPEPVVVETQFNKIFSENSLDDLRVFSLRTVCQSFSFV